MTSIEEIRQVVISAFQAFQTAEYPTLLVNYPNFMVVDLERQELPFLGVNLDISESDQSAIGEKDIFVRGVLNIYYNYRDGTGMSGSYIFSDSLNINLCMNEVDGIRYNAVQVLNTISFPGWQGSLNMIPFTLVKGVVC